MDFTSFPFRQGPNSQLPVALCTNPNCPLGLHCSGRRAGFAPFHTLAFPCFKQMMPLSTTNKICQELHGLRECPAVPLLLTVFTWKHNDTPGNAQTFCSQSREGSFGCRNHDTPLSSSHFILSTPWLPG